MKQGLVTQIRRFSSINTRAFHISTPSSNAASAIRLLGKFDNTVSPPTSEYVIKGYCGTWGIVVGLEIHAQINSLTKLISSAPTSYGAFPNSNVAFVDASLPGTLPTLNEKCVRQTIRTGLILNGQVQLESSFDRKHYFYCDMPSGYQITQYNQPLVIGGNVQIQLPPNYATKNIHLERIQLETDSGKSLYYPGSQYTHIDLNRAGCGLMEIVTRPDMNSPCEVITFVKKIQHLLQYIESCDGNMEEGSLRCDVNVNVERLEDGKKSPRCEIKNLNSFKSIYRAVEYEAHRHIYALENNYQIVQQTRFFDPMKRATFLGRAKENLIDYRIFNEPDLPRLVIDEQFLNSISKSMPEHPDKIFDRLVQQYGLKHYESHLIVNTHGAVEYFEKVARGKNYASVANWIVNEIFSHTNRLSMHECPVSADDLREILDLIEQRVISARIAKNLILQKFQGETKNVNILIAEQQLLLNTDLQELTDICQTLIDEHPDVALQYKNGRNRKMKFFVGEAMRITNGRANGNLVSEICHRIIHEKF